MSLAMSLRGRGPVGSAARTALVLSRFGATASGMSRRLDRYDALTAEHGVRPTWPTTACVLERHPALLREYAARGAELALHGLVHGDHAMLDERQQRESIARAVDVFERCGVPPTGFRGPYLRYNSATLAVLRELGLRYHCSQAFTFPVLEDADLFGRAAASYRLALALYSARDARSCAVTPRLREGLVDIPVAIPDDEILVERLRLSAAARQAKWLAVLEMSYCRGDLFTMQFHPERTPELEGALRATLEDARGRRPRVFVARLDEIASWWLRRSRFSLDVRRRGTGQYHIHVEADPDATVLTRGIDAGIDGPWLGADSVCARRDIDITSPRAPVVGISRRSPAAVQAFLSEEGLPFEISDEGRLYGAFVDAPDGWSEAEVLDTIAAAPGPLVRIWRWPAAARSALAITGDIDALTLRDFVSRSWETRRRSTGT